jgi:hypothetical protein
MRVCPAAREYGAFDATVPHAIHTASFEVEMRRSSCFALAAAIVMLGGLGLLFLLSQDRGAGGMDRATAEAFLSRGRSMLASGDADGIMGLFAPDSRVLGTTPDKLRPEVISAIRDMNGRQLRAVTRNLQVKQEADSAFLTFDLDLDEKQKGVNIHYFTSHVNLTLRKTVTVHMLGLYRTTDWTISQLDADPPFGYSDI